MVRSPPESEVAQLAAPRVLVLEIRDSWDNPPIVDEESLESGEFCDEEEVGLCWLLLPLLPLLLELRC